MINLPRSMISVALMLAAVSEPAVIHAQTTHSFILPAQSLSDSLRQLGSQAGLNVVFDPAAVSGRMAHNINCDCDAKEALGRLLEGTGFTADFTNATTVVIKPLSKPPEPASRIQPFPSSDARVEQRRERTPVTSLPKITVLGSLIPRSRIETASPIIIITAQAIKEHGFASVADALQNAAVNTGAVNNTAIGSGDIWAAKTLSLFGLNPSFTKYLVDGRPMALYSTLAQAQTADQLYTNLNGIPIDLVDHIEILPGGQSSLYGSDAIAGVVNIVLKKHIDFATLDARIGWYPDGGGRERMISATDGFDVGKLNMTLGVQLSDQQPMWDFQRSITAQNFSRGLNPQQANANAVAEGLFFGKDYFPTQPADCSSLSRLWGGSEKYYAGSGRPFCGSVSNGAYQTLMNKQQAASFSGHANYALTDDIHLYADFSDDYQKVSNTLNPIFFSLFDDANLHDLVLAERRFAPEEIASNLDGLLQETSYQNTYLATLGGKVDFSAGWNLDVGFTRSYNRIDHPLLGLFANNVPGSFGSALLGPQLGTKFGYPVYSPPNGLGALGDPLTPAQLASYMGRGTLLSNDRSDQLRAQLTQPSLFVLPGGDAGLALVAEEGYDTWKYLPSSSLTSGDLLANGFAASSGHRARKAAAAEMQLPLFRMLTADISARYDTYDAEGAHFGHPTYSMGLEFRPVETLLLRGKYTTSFKAPSLADEFEGGSSGATLVTDWVNCGRLGSGTNVGNCPFQYAEEPAVVSATSNPSLLPITAKSLSYGVVWSPLARLTMSLDYQHISIRNEVLRENSDYVLQTSALCLNGPLDPQSPTCQHINGEISRGPASPGSPLLGPILAIVTTKANIASEINNSLNASADYRLSLGALGQINADAAYTRLLAHRQKQFPGDPELDYLNNPRLSTEFASKGNVSLTWSRAQWSATLFGTYFGPTPNLEAQYYGYAAPNAGKVAAWHIFNASINYSPMPALQLSLRINNIKNSMPPLDVTQFGNYNIPFTPGNYNPYGRELFVEARYQFGHDGNH